MFRLLLLLLLLLPTLTASADNLNTRLRQLLPGEDAATVNERQFLYQRLNGLFTTLREEDKADRKSTKKRIRRIHDRLRKELFLSYRFDASFSDAFRSGAYNDATAAAITALALEKFEVDFDLHVDHWDSYLVADPEGRATRLDHPAVTKGDEDARRSFRREYLSLLRQTVLTDIGALTQQEADGVFREYYYDPAKRLTFGQLAAFQLYRRAQQEYADDQFARVSLTLAEAIRREERPAFLVLDQAARLQLAALTRPEVEGDTDMLFSQWRENPANRYLPAALLNYFDDRQRILIANQEVAAAQRMLSEYRDRAPAGQTVWSDQLQRLQDFRLIGHYQQQARLNDALTIAKRLYAEDPTDERTKYLLGELLLADLRRTRGEEADLARLQEEIATEFPFVRHQDRFADLLLRRKAMEVRDLYDGELGPAGNLALEEFRRALIDIPIGRDRSLWTLTAFVSASNFYFREDNYPMARALIDEALKYGPEDDYLLHRREVLARY